MDACNADRSISVVSSPQRKQTALDSEMKTHNPSRARVLRCTRQQFADRSSNFSVVPREYPTYKDQMPDGQH